MGRRKERSYLFFEMPPSAEGGIHTLKLDSKVGGAPEADSPVLEIQSRQPADKKKKKKALGPELATQGTKDRLRN